MTTKNLVPVYDIQHYISEDSGETWIQVTEDRSFSPDREVEEYATEYLDRKTQATYALSSKDTIEFEVDAVGNSDFQKFLMAHEDDLNVEVDYCRTIAWDFAQQQAAPATARVAKKAHAVLNVKPLSGEANEPAVISGTLVVTEAYVAGTFNETTKAFTATP